MKRVSCARLWQAEAIEDGRLGGQERASFERHVATCKVCSAERVRLAELSDLSAGLPVLETSPLERRRQRQGLLRQANQLAVEPPRVSRRILAVAVVLGATTAVAATGAYVMRPVESQHKAAHVTVSSSASERSMGGVRARAMPVAAQPIPEASAQAAGTTARQAAAVPRTPVRHAAPPISSPPRHGKQAVVAEVEAAPAPHVPATRAPSPGQDFGRAMTAFNAGDFGRAERLFAAFARAHPEDSRAEDASFLRAVARQRRGDTEGAKGLARDYLDRYPGALRQQEAEAMLDR